MSIDSALTANFIIFGLANSSMSLTNMGPGINNNGWSYYQQTGQKYYNNMLSTYGSSYTNGDVIGMAYDPISGKVWFAKNNAWQASGDPETGANPAFTELPSDLYAAVGLYNSTAPAHVITGRFDTADFSYSPPAGFNPWNDEPIPIQGNAIVSTSLDWSTPTPFAAKLTRRATSPTAHRAHATNLAPRPAQIGFLKPVESVRIQRKSYANVATGSGTDDAPTTGQLWPRTA